MPNTTYSLTPAFIVFTSKTGFQTVSCRRMRKSMKMLIMGKSLTITTWAARWN